MDKIQKFIDDMNNDLESRKRGLETNPFEKQGTFMELYPGVAVKHPELLFLSEGYYPNRDKVDSANKAVVIARYKELQKDHDYKQDMSMKKAA